MLIDDVVWSLPLHTHFFTLMPFYRYAVKNACAIGELIYMNNSAKSFLSYLVSNKIDSFKVDDLKDEHNSVIFRSTLILKGQSIPIGVIIDDTIYAIVRVNIAVHVINDDNYDELVNLIMRLNNRSKLFKYYITPDLSVIMDVCLPFEKEHLSCELLYRMVAVTAQELDAHYKDFVKLLWHEKKQE